MSLPHVVSVATLKQSAELFNVPFYTVLKKFVQFYSVKCAVGRWTIYL